MKMQGLLYDKKDKSLTYPEIVNLGSYDAIIEDMAKRGFRTLERMQSTPDMLDKLISLFRLSITDSLKEDALLYLQLRHLIIHNYGKADDKFITKNTEGKVKINNINKKITYNYELSNTAMNIVFELCKSIDDELIRQNLLP